MAGREAMLINPDDETEESSSEKDSLDTSEPIAREPDMSADRLKEYLEHLRPEDFGKFNL